MRKRGIIFGLAAGLLWGLDGAMIGRYTENAESILYMTLLTACFHDGAAAYSCSITSAYPVIGSIIGIIFLGERPGKTSIVGILFTAVGAAVMGFISDGQAAHISYFSFNGRGIFLFMLVSGDGYKRSYNWHGTERYLCAVGGSHRYTVESHKCNPTVFLGHSYNSYGYGSGDIFSIRKER